MARSSITVKGAPASKEQRRILSRALELADRWNAPYKAKVALVEALIIESEAKNLGSASADGYGSYGVLQGRDIYHKRSDLMDPDYQVGVFLGRGRGGKKTGRKGFTGRGNAISLAGSGMKSGDIAQAIEGSAYPDRYQQVQREAMHIVKTLGTPRMGGVGAVGKPTTVTLKGAKTEQVDQAAYQKAKGQAVLGAFLKKRNPNNPLLKLGVVSDRDPNPADYVKTVKAPDTKVTLPGQRPARKSSTGATGGLPSQITHAGGWLERLTGLPVTARQEPGHATGGDHDPSVRGATARDFGGDEATRKAAFKKLTRQLGVRNAVYKGADINVVKNGLRYQIISRDHGTGPHLHVGVRKT